MSQELKAAIDWEIVETEYRAGVLSVREIGAAHGVSHVAISKRAKRDGWERDLSAKIKAKADSLVTKQVVTSSVTKEKAVTDKTIVEANAQVIANIRLAHRGDIRSSRELTMTLFRELQAETADIDSLVMLGELMASPDDKGIDKLNDLYKKIISLPSRTDTMKKLSDTLKTLIALEREAYGLEASSEGGGTVTRIERVIVKA